MLLQSILATVRSLMAAENQTADRTRYVKSHHLRVGKGPELI